MRRKILSILCLAAMLICAGCKTAENTGKKLDDAGKALSDSAQKAKDSLEKSQENQ